MTYRVVVVRPDLPCCPSDGGSTGRVTIQSCRSNGGSVLNLDGNIAPAQRWNLALGESSPGRPWNRSSWAYSPLTVSPISRPSSRYTHFGNRFSHCITSSHARSFKKLWIATTISMCSSGAPWPLRTSAL